MRSLTAAAVYASFALLISTSGCESRSVQVDEDTSTDHASDGGGEADASRGDLAVWPDAGTCGGKALEMSFTADFDGEVSGRVSYHGPVSGSSEDPALDHEIRLVDADNNERVVQYHLPSRLKLPSWLQVGATLTFVFLDASSAKGLVIKRPTSGLHPLMLVAEIGYFGKRAFDPDSHVTFPVEVDVIEQPDCRYERLHSNGCTAIEIRDRLHFETSSASNNQLELLQSESGTISVFGDDFTAINLSSYRFVTPMCLDGPWPRLSYLVMRD